MEIEQTRDTIVSKLTSTHGDDLEIMANLTDSGQTGAILEGLVGKLIGDDVAVAENETLLHMTISWRGRGRDDLTSIGKTPDTGWRGNNES
jgi:hypothetical protein